MMKAWLLTKNGDPLNAFVLREVEAPTLKPGHVRIMSEGFGLNYADAMAVAGLYREAPPLPSIIGYEMVGRVTECGEGVAPDLRGKRVLALTRFGGYAQQAVVDMRGVVQLSEDIPIGEALALGTQGCTAWYMATYAFPLMAGQRVLVHSAAGGVGQMLVRIAQHRGCEVFAVVGSKAKADRIRSMGVHHVVDRSQGDYAMQARNLLGKSRFDVSFNPVAGATFKKDMGLVGSGGAVVLFGGAARSGKAGGIFASLKFVWDMGLLLPIGLMMRSKSVIGINMLKLGDHRPELMGRCLREVVQAHTDGIVRPHVHGLVAVADMPEALADLGAGRTMGKVAVVW
ncbi:MAG: zinc-binding dehydrogenase [Flavobacteriales bacterium]